MLLTRLKCKCIEVSIQRLYNWRYVTWLMMRLLRMYTCLYVVVCAILDISREDSLLPTITVASRGTKIVLCLLPRLQHWQHDVPIHSQYCISLAFCEKVAANLSPQSTRLSMWRGEQPRYGMKGVGSALPLHIAPSSTHQGPLPLAPPPHSSSPGIGMFPQLADKSHWSPAAASIWWVKIRAVSMQTHVSLFHSAGTQWLGEERGVEWQLDGSHNKTIIERYVIVTISS